MWAGHVSTYHTHHIIMPPPTTTHTTPTHKHKTMEFEQRPSLDSVATITASGANRRCKCSKYRLSMLILQERGRLLCTVSSIAIGLLLTYILSTFSCVITGTKFFRKNGRGAWTWRTCHGTRRLSFPRSASTTATTVSLYIVV